MKHVTPKIVALPEQRPHTVADSIRTAEVSVRVAENGLRNLTEMSAAFPDARLEEKPGLGLVWVSDSADAQIHDFAAVSDENGQSFFLPYAEAGTIRVYLPVQNPKSRVSFSSFRERSPDLHSQLSKLLAD